MFTMLEQPANLLSGAYGLNNPNLYTFSALRLPRLAEGGQKHGRAQDRFKIR